MILDLSSERLGSEIDADICIVGAGAAGISIAHRLMNSGLKICLIESGGYEFSSATQELYAGESIGHPIVPDVGRYRQFGGSTNRWTGRCAWLDAIDFASRPWVPNSDWPIGYSDLIRYYPEAQRVCGFPEPWEPADPLPPHVAAGARDIGSDELDLFIWRYAMRGRRKYVNWGVEYRDALLAAENCLAILHANLVQYDVDVDADHQRVRSITIASLAGQKATIRARTFVLCCGGIENVRLLLHSAATVPYGLGNRYDQVGRYFMQHPRGRTADLVPTPDVAHRLQRLFNVFPAKDGVQYETGLALSAKAQRQGGALNCSGILLYDENRHSAWSAAKTFGRAVRSRHFSSASLRDAAVVVRRPDRVAGNLLRHLQTHKPVQLELSGLSLQVDLEQAPNPESRIQLSDRRDALGLRQVQVDWRLTEHERNTARLFTEHVAAQFRRLGLGELNPRRWLYETAPITTEGLEGNYHHIGGTRMSMTPHSGVVDGDGRVHGTANLFMSGCSVFSTGGHANPTLTIVALALRLADHIKSEFNNIGGREAAVGSALVEA